MIRRTASALLLVYLLGFLWFGIFLPAPAGPVKTDAIVVLTGSSIRIDRGVEALRAGLAPRMLVSGVDQEVRPAEFAAEYGLPMAKLRCCVTLGYEAVDTRSNAREAADFIARHHIGSVRLITSDWHMRRAALDLGFVAPTGLIVIEDAVTTRPRLSILFLEYNKLLARLAQRVIGL